MKKYLCLLGVAAVFAASQASAQKITIRAATFTPERSITVRFAFKPWIAAVEKELGGDVKIQGYWGGSLGRNPRKQLDLVLDGVADVASVVPGYTPGKFPGFGIFELPYMFRSGTEASEAMWRMLQANQLKGFDKVKVVGFYATDTYGFHTKKPMKSLDDLKGMKIRIAGPVQAETAKFFGAVPIGMPITQATEALSRGVIDGGLFGYSGVDDLPHADHRQVSLFGPRFRCAPDVVDEQEEVGQPAQASAGGNRQARRLADGQGRRRRVRQDRQDLQGQDGQGRRPPLHRMGWIDARGGSETRQADP